MTTGETPPRPPQPRRHNGPGQPWLDQETAHLIDAYEERWYGLRRGQLKAHQWEEVAAGVAARLGLPRAHKSGTQCRHKIEKLRQRYRAERQRGSGAPSRWAFFDRMDRMERGPLPLSIRPPLSLPPPTNAEEDEEEEEEEVGGEDEEEDSDGDEESCDEEAEEGEEREVNGGNTRSLSGILRKDNWRDPKIATSSGYWEEDRSEEGEMRAVKELVVTVQRFSEGLARMEKRKLELMKEMQRDWMEMEAKMAERVVASQRHMMDTIARAVRSIKKPKNVQEM